MRRTRPGSLYPLGDELGMVDVPIKRTAEEQAEIDASLAARGAELRAYRTDLLHRARGLDLGVGLPEVEPIPPTQEQQ